MRTKLEFTQAMKHLVLMLFVAASAASVIAQTPAKPATPAKHAVAHTAVSGIKLPSGVPPVHGIVKTAFSLRYQDIKIGTGALAEPNKLYKVQYTGWLASDGRKFDSSYDHRTAVMDKDGKPERDAKGELVMGDPQPIAFPQGYGRVIPGFDQGFAGMKIGGKRRLFIPWQMAYGERGRPGPDPAHPGIPPKADLIFDVELVDVSDLQMPPNHMGIMPGGHPMQPGMTMPPQHVAPASPKPAEPTAPATPATPTKPAEPQPQTN
jgi:peptidylprolyl isomerase